MISITIIISIIISSGSNNSIIIVTITIITSALVGDPAGSQHVYYIMMYDMT